MNPTSNLFRELTAPELDAVVAAHLGVAVYQARLLEGGMFNTTYLITPIAGEKAVLRVGPVHRHLLLPYEENLMQAERHVYERCAPLGVPVPRVLACDSSKTLLDRDYMITAYIDGTALADMNASEQVKQAMHRETGRCARMIHSLEGEQFGRVADLLRGKGHARWSDCLRAEIAGFAEKTANTKIYTAKQLRRMEDIYARHAGLLDEITTPRLVHADLWGGNILVTEQNTLAAVIDADRAIYGDIDFEFASGWMIDDAFCEGYGTQPAPDKASVTRRRLYRLLYKLLDSYILSAQYNDWGKSRANKNPALRLMRGL